MDYKCTLINILKHMKKHLTRKNLFRTLLVLFILAQLQTIDKTPMDTRPENDLLVMTNAPEDVRTLLKTACYDCHSNSTNWPGTATSHL